MDLRLGTSLSVRAITLRCLLALLALILLAIVVTAVAAAAPGVRDAKRLALTEADFPSRAVRMSERSNTSAPLPGGQRGQAYTTTFQFPRGQKRERVLILVVTSGSATTARRVFAGLVSEARREAGAKQVRLRSYGAEQFAALTGRVQLDEASASIIVRQGTVVWSVSISTDPVAKDFGLTRADALAELATYAAKQQRRVGRG